VATRSATGALVELRQQQHVAGAAERGQRADLAGHAHAVAVGRQRQRAAAVAAGRREPAGREAGEQLGLGGVAAPARDRQRRLDVALEQRRHRRAAAAQLEAAQRARHVRVGAVEQAAGRLGHRVEEEAQLAGHGRQLVGRRGRAVGVAGPRPQLLVDEAAHGLDDQRLVVIECEVHGGSIRAARIAESRRRLSSLS
jgi:hypothetical protein